MSSNIAAYAERDPEQRFRQALDWLIDGISADGSRYST
jgi:hypothetical protein